MLTSLNLHFFAFHFNPFFCFTTFNPLLLYHLNPISFAFPHSTHFSLLTNLNLYIFSCQCKARIICLLPVLCLPLSTHNYLHSILKFQQLTSQNKLILLRILHYSLNQNFFAHQFPALEGVFYTQVVVHLISQSLLFLPLLSHCS